MTINLLEILALKDTQVIVAEASILPLTINFGHPAASIGSVTLKDLTKVKVEFDHTIEAELARQAVNQGKMKFVTGGQLSAEMYKIQQVSLIPSNFEEVAGNINK